MSTPDTATSDGHGVAAGRVGPNAITQLLVALRAAGLDLVAAEVFAGAGVAEWLAEPPGAMVDEVRVARVHQRLRAALPREQAENVLRDAGRLTADYLLAHRIPRAVGAVLKLLPGRIAAMILVRAIRAHAWTFAGTGRFSARAGNPTMFVVENNPFCRGERAEGLVCIWHAAVFRRLFAVLVSRSARVEETACSARGDPCCCFAVAWGRRDARVQSAAERNFPTRSLAASVYPSSRVCCASSPTSVL